MSRLIAFLYGLVSYLVSFATILSPRGLVSGLFVPKVTDDGTIGPWSMPFGTKSPDTKPMA